MTQTTSSNIALIEYWNTNPARGSGCNAVRDLLSKYATPTGVLMPAAVWIVSAPRRKPLVAARSIAVSAIAQLRYAANLGLAALMLDTHGRS